MPKRHPEEFRRRVLDLVAAGRPIGQIAADLGISDQTIYGWRKQELIDTGQLPGLNRAEQAELSAANKRIRELENEVAILKRARELLRERAMNWQRERAMKRLTSARHAQRFLSAFSGISPLFRVRRHLLSAADYRQVMTDRFAVWVKLPHSTLPPEISTPQS